MPFLTLRASEDLGQEFTRIAFSAGGSSWITKLMAVICSSARVSSVILLW